ncbi:hypothetical protein EKD04_016505 [Chloroflexales bacterium ZM16-3]|nr:hypothetical protein [Chloroflexales bacterium ZM16-3]
MGYIPVRDEQGRIVDMVRSGPFQSDDEPTELRRPPAAPDTTAPPSAIPPSRERPRRRSHLGDELSGQNQHAQWGGLAAIAVVAILIYLAWPTVQRQVAAPAAPIAATPAAEQIAGAAVTASSSPTPLILARAVIAYDAPGGAPLGALEPGRPYERAEQIGIWRRLRLAMGDVWVRGWEMDGMPPPSPTPSPFPTAIPAPVVLPPPVPAYVQPTPAPQATCKVVILDGDTIGQACGTSADQLQSTAFALMRTPHGGFPLEIVTPTALNMTPPPAAP